ncbi:equilibrative nucleobase transporter 1-like [Saccostrea echinata]|uniref:equilibrative nucleobase transporter 1-like n=1 Tax=Saccostrea echinata TaxID=191078 RepID=UPI002A8106F3|nr:equilibrative nucleobase transporter 1-like [Saccostrea echinata]
MELCYRWRILCTIWSSLEVVCFAGIIWGWGSLVFILKEEGIYQEFCDDSSIKGASPSKVINNTSPLDNNISIPLSNVTKSCHAQEEKLNLWFSIAVGSMYCGLAIVGQLSMRLGTRITRIICTSVYIIGFLCTAFASKEMPWLLLPGLSCIAIGGLSVFCTTLQVANLYTTIQTTIVALFSGLFDASTIIQHFIKVAFENGIPRRHSYLFLCGMGIVIFNVQTFVFLPKDHIKRSSCIQQKKTKRINSDTETNDTLLETEENNNRENCVAEEDNVKTHILSFAYLSHTVWMSINVLLFVTFVGLLNTWLSNMTKNSSTVSYYLDAFAYTTISTCITAIVAGFVYDWQRKRFKGSPVPGRYFFPICLPMAITWLFGTLCYLLPLVFESFSVVLPVFIMFTFYRSFLFSIGIAFLGEAFPLKYFGVLYGTAMFSVGSTSLLQYAFFEWSSAYKNGFTHVNVCLLLLAVSMCYQPILLWIRGGINKPSPENDINNMEIVLNPPS